MFFTASVETGSPLKLTINNTSGDVFIAPDEVTQLEIEATLTSGTPNEGDHGDWIFETDGNTVSLRPNLQIGQAVSSFASKVKTQLKEGFRAEDWDLKKIRNTMDATYDLMVRVPRNIAADSIITARTASGDMTIEGLEATISATTASGDIALSNLTGKISAHAASGDIKLSELRGSVEANAASGDVTLNGGEGWCALRSASGDVEARNFTMKNARVATVNGDMSFDVVMSNAGNYSFDTVNGDIRLTTTVPGSGASLTYKAMSGDAKATGAWISEGKNAWQIAAGSDGPHISVKAVRGDLRANAIVQDSLHLTREDLPNDVDQDIDVEERQAHLEHEIGRMDEKVSANEAQTYSSERHADTDRRTSDFDWERTKSWLKDVTGKVSQFVSDMDEAGDRHRASRQAHSRAGETEPVVVEGTVTDVPSEEKDTFTIQSNESATQETGKTEPVTPDVETVSFDVTDSTETTATEPLGTDGLFTSDEPSSETKAAPTTGDQPETTAQRRIRLLEAVKRGEMTVDEALAQLDDDPTN